MLAVSTTLCSATTNPRDWKETAYVPLGTSFAIPDVVSSALQDNDNITVSIPNIGKGEIRITDFAKLKDATYERIDVTILNESLSASLGYISASASTSRFRATIVEQWTKYLPVTLKLDTLPSFAGKRTDRKSVNCRIGISISIVTQVDSNDVRASLSGLIKSFTAGLDYQKYSFFSGTEIIGVSGKTLTEKLPSASDFLKAQADAASRETNPELVPMAKYQALLTEAAESFNELKNAAWSDEDISANTGAIYVRPSLIAIDLDAFERLTGKVYAEYNNRGK